MSSETHAPPNEDHGPFTHKGVRDAPINPVTEGSMQDRYTRSVSPSEIMRLQKGMWYNFPEYASHLWRTTKYDTGVPMQAPYEMWEKQKEVAFAIKHHRRVAVRSGNGVGKTRLGATTAIMFLMTHYPAFVVTTGSSWRVLEDVLWPEIRDLIKTSTVPLGAPPQMMSWAPIPKNDRWKIISASAKDKNNFAGFHNAHVLVVIEEADGVSQDIFEAAEGNAVGENDRILAIGNPHTPGSAFYKLFQSPDWYKVHISCLDHPNVQTGREIIPGMVSRQWVDKMARDYGERSAVYRARVLGEFPEDDAFVIVAYHWLVAATRRELGRDYHQMKLQRVLSVDVARSPTGDRTVFCKRDDRKLLELRPHQGVDTMVIVGMIIDALHDDSFINKVVIDDTGVGGGVVDRLREVKNSSGDMLSHVSIVAFQGGTRAQDYKRFTNARSEAFWKLREAMHPNLGDNGLVIDIKHEDSLMELTQIRQKPQSDGRIALMPKDEMIKLGYLKRSPDFADALSMTYAPAVIDHSAPQDLEWKFGR